MKKSLLLFSLCLGTVVSAQVDPTVLTVDEQAVSRGEFEAIYKKNNKDADVTKGALDEYMELFINYKLKVREAESLGMDTISKFQSELAGYRTQLARPYLIDRELNETLLREAYERKGQEVRASHILVQITGDQTPVDTAAAWKRIQELRTRVTTGGEDFSTVAQGKGGSDDPSAKSNGGDLGYFTALQMVYPFENGAYNTAIGEVSQVVRTRFGYHILKVVNKRPARGEIKTAHIMIRSVAEDGDAKREDAEKRIREVYTRVLEGKETFADLALKFSEDPGSSSKGGDLPKFGTGKMVESFENAAFSLAKDGDVSEPFTTQYGWHIVKRMAYEPVASFEEMRGQLKSRIAKDSRAEMTKRSFIAQLKKEYNFTTYPKNMTKLIKKKFLGSELFAKGNSVNDTVSRGSANLGEVLVAGKAYDRKLNGVLRAGKVINVRSREFSDVPESVDDTVVVRQISRGWNYNRLKAAKMQKPLFTLNGKSFTQEQFLGYVESKQRGGTVPEGAWQTEYANNKFSEWVEEEVIEYENGRLEAKYPEFRLLMKEYRDGILLFELTDEKVWSKAVSDSTGLLEFHNGHRDQFMWEKRWKATSYKCGDAGIAKKVRAMIKKKKTQGEILESINSTSSLALTIETSTYDAEKKPYFQNISDTGFSKNIEVDGQVVFVDVEEILEPAPKELDEARGMITAAYQDHLEAEWIAELRAKYKYTVNEEVLYGIK